MAQLSNGKISRRTFVLAGSGVAAAIVLRLRHGTDIVVAKAKTPKEVKIVEFSSSGQRGDTITVPMTIKTDQEWKQQLSAAAYEVTRHEGTEKAYSGEYWNLHEKGLYHCICCDTTLFNSDTKFESGTGWPSFWQPIAKENIHESMDLSMGMGRTAVTCRRCDAHLGHVFEDGPKPTGLRYCMNSVALRFAKLT